MRSWRDHPTPAFVAQEIFAGVSENFLGGDGKAEGAKVPGAGISLKQCQEKMSGRKRLAY